MAGQLGSDGRLTMEKWKRYINNNLCMYCGDKSHRVKICSLYPSGTTRLQAKCVKAISSISEVTLTTQSGNQNVGYSNLIYLNATTLSDLNSLTLLLTSLLVCKSDHIQNIIFHALIDFRFTYYFIDSIFVLRHNILTKPILPIELKLFNGLSNNTITCSTSPVLQFLDITGLSNAIQ